jgi:secreted Zn-dependent insulinase-like peptidase
MDDGYASKNGVTLCTECFTDAEIKLLKSVLESKFKLEVSQQRRVTSTGIVSSRLYINTASREQLHSLVLPYFIPSMLYKLNIK